MLTDMCSHLRDMMCSQTLIFCLVVCVLLLIVGLLVRSGTTQSNKGDSSSGLALTTWLDGQPPAYYETGNKPVWTDEQILTQADAFDFMYYGTQATGIMSARLGLRLVYTGAANTTMQDMLFDYAFQKIFAANATLYQAMLAETDPDYTSLLNTNRRKLGSMGAVESSCRKLFDVRFAAVQNLYNGLYNTSSPTKSTTLAPLLVPLLIAAAGGDYANMSDSQKAKVSLEMELGVRDAFGRAYAAPIAPRPKMYTCVVMRLNALDTAAMHADYTLSYEYFDGLSYQQSWILDQKPWDTSNVPCGGSSSLSGAIYGCATDYYQSTRFIQVQKALDEAFINLFGGSNLTYPSSFTYPTLFGARCNGFPTKIISLMMLVCLFSGVAMLPFVPLPGAIAAKLTMEKESKMKLLLLVLGMSPHSFWISWLIVYLPMLLIISVVVTFAMVGFYTQGAAFLLFFIGCVLHSFFLFGFAFLVSTFFSSAASANRVTHVLSFALFVTYFISGYLRVGILYPFSAGWFYLLCLIEPIAFGTLIQRLMVGDALWGPSLLSEPYADQPTPWGLLGLMLVDAVLICVLGILFEIVLSEEYGDLGLLAKVRSMCSCCACGGGNRVGDPNGEFDAECAPDTRDVEPVQSNAAPAMEVRNLWKEFPAEKRGQSVVCAVQGFCLDVYEGEITCLLGPNGAGKSTFLSMLMGLMRPNKGSIQVFQMDMSNIADRQKARKSMGFCLQQNILYDSLTVDDHMRFIAKLREIPSELVDIQINGLLEELNLTKALDQTASSLSGGQQRRLSICMSLLGDPRFCVLDEPTTGVDAVSRREIWSALKARRKDRVIMFTTHFMDEADLLADRKAIMTSGRLRCAGSSLFLKTRFGLGYSLRMDLKQEVREEQVAAIEKLVAEKVPGASCKRTPNLLLFTLPLSATSRFPALFDALDGRGGAETFASAHGVQAYGVAMTNLEQVFLRLASATQSENVVQKPKKERSPKRAKSATTDASTAALELTDVKSPEKNGVAKGNANGKANGGASQQSALDELLARVDREQNGVDHQNFETDTVRALAQVLLNQEISGIWMLGRMWVLLKVFMWNSLRNTFALVFKLIIAVGVVLGFTLFVALLQLKSTYTTQQIALSKNWSAYIPLTSGNSAPPAQPLSFLSYYNSNVAATESLFEQSLQNYQVSFTHVNTSAIQASAGSPPWDTKVPLASNINTQVCTRLRNASNPAAGYKVVPQSMVRIARVQDYVPVSYTLSNGTVVTQYVLAPEVTVAYNTTALHSLPIAVNLLSNTLLYETLLSAGKSGVSPRIDVIADQLSFNTRSEFYDGIIKNGIAQVLASPFVLVASIACLLILAFAGAEVVSDRECGVMYLLRLSGVRAIDYWLARFLFDLPQYIILMALLLFLILQPWTPLYALDSWGARGLMIIGAALSAVQCILLVYVTSFMFQRAGSALLFYVLCLLVLPAVVYIVLWILDILITTNSNLGSSSSSSSTTTTTTASSILQTVAAITPIPPITPGFNLPTIYQALRFFAIYFLPPYDLVAVAIQIEGNFTTMFGRIITHITDPTAVDDSTMLSFFANVTDVREGAVVYPFTAMGAHIIIFLFLLYVLHDRTYFAYRPLFWCCAKPDDPRDPETAENPAFMPDHQYSNGHANGNSQNGTPPPNGGKPAGAQDDDVLQERSEVYRVVDRMNSRCSSRSNSAVAPKEANTSEKAPPLVLYCAEKEYERPSKVCCCPCCCCCPQPPPKRALKGVNLQLKAGELFGLLGPNGAGKTTAMKLIAGDEDPTRGQVFLEGEPLIKQGASEMQERLNYCPQKDTMWPRLTMGNLFSVFARLRGLSSESEKRLVEESLKALRLEQYMDREFDSLSGGTKRKVLFLASVMGNCSTVLFDEPTSGLDPESRRLLWNVMLALFQQSAAVAPTGGSSPSVSSAAAASAASRSCVLTTHSLEEAEALCSRIAIMLHGEIFALGSIQHLKNKLGAGFNLEMNMQSEDRLTAAQQYVQTKFPHAVENERFGKFISYRVPMIDVQSLGRVFERLEAERATVGIQEYSFSQVSLEQLFIDLANRAEAEDAADDEEN